MRAIVPGASYRQTISGLSVMIGFGADGEVCSFRVRRKKQMENIEMGMLDKLHIVEKAFDFIEPMLQGYIKSDNSVIKKRFGDHGVSFLSTILTDLRSDSKHVQTDLKAPLPPQIPVQIESAPQ